MPNKLPYNASSVNSIFTDFKGLLYSHAIAHSRKTRLGLDECLSEAYMIFLDSIECYEDTYQEDVRASFGRYLDSTLRYGLAGIRRDFIKQINRCTPFRYLTDEESDMLFSDTLANSDYGAEANDKNNQITAERIMREIDLVLGVEDANIIRARYGFIDGGFLDYRNCGDLLNMSHESIRKGDKRAIDILKRKYWRDIAIVTGKVGVTPDDE